MDDRLTITVRNLADGPVTVWTLVDDPPGGDHPDPVAACAALRAATDPFAPVPRGMLCAQVYGGPQTATIEGVWQGRQVHATYSRVNACEIARWKALSAVLEPVDRRETATGSAGA